MKKRKFSNLSKALVLKALRQIFDPELSISIIDLGLIYNLEVDKKKKTVKVLMTLTTPFCPFNNFILEQVKEKIYQIGAKKVQVELTFEPMWTPKRLNSKLIKLKKHEKQKTR